MQHNYRSRYLLAIDSEHSIVNIYKYEKFKFEKLFLVLKPSEKIVGKSRMCRITEMSGACDNSDFDGKTKLVGSDVKGFIFISGFEIINFKTEDKMIEYISLLSNNLIPTAIAMREKNIFLI